MALTNVVPFPANSQDGLPENPEVADRATRRTLALFIQYQKIRLFSPNTIRAYETTLLEFFKDAGSIESVERKTVLLFLSKLYERRNSPSTRSRALSCLKSFFRFCQAEGLIQKNPVELIEHPKLPKRLPKVWNTEQLNGLIDQIGNVRVNSELWMDARDRLMFEIMYGSGLRVGELVALNMEDVDRHQKLLFVRQGKGRKDRVAPFGQRTADALGNYYNLRRPSAALIVNDDFRRITTRSVARIVKQYGKRFCNDDTLHPHLLRHGCATAMVENGADIAYVRELLGHESLSTTQVYVHLSLNHLRKIYSKAHPRNANPYAAPAPTGNELDDRTRLREWRRQMRELQKQGKISDPSLILPDKFYPLSKKAETDL